MKKVSLRTIGIKKSLIALSIFAAAGIGAYATHSHLSPVSNAYAEEDGEGGQGAGYKGPHGMGKQGSERPGDSVPGKGSGQGGPSGDSDAKGPRYGGGSASPTPGDKGGKPVWAQEGVPEGDYGRLNVARAPSHVIDKALTEALSNLSSSGTDLYKLDSLDAVIAAIKSSEYYRVDSPLENIGLYRDLLSDSKIGDGTLIPVTSDNFLTLAAIFLGGAADKTVPITADTVTAMDTILNLSLPEGITAEQLATAADSVRAAILEEHGE